MTSEFDDFNPFEDLGLTEHIQMTYSLAFPMNKTTVTLVRRPTLDEGNFGSETKENIDIYYTVQMNINPVRAKPYRTDKEGIVKTFSHEVFTNPLIYPKTGKDINGEILNIPLAKVLATDLIIFGNERFSLSESFEDVSLNDQDILWQHFFLKIIN